MKKTKLGQVLIKGLKEAISGPKILALDIETSPIVSYTWGLFDQNVALNQVKEDWSVLAWCAKWVGEKKIMYMDQRKAKEVRDDKEILKAVWKLLDEADIVLTQNGKSFDVKKLNARFIINGMQPPSSFKQIDTLRLARKIFGFTSNKLEYMSNKLCLKYKKLKVKKFQGFELWSECLNGNLEAWKQMERYNKMDVLSLEELYRKLIPWETSINFNLYSRDNVTRCTCGSSNFQKNGYFYSAAGKFQRYRCGDCGAEIRDKQNLLSKSKKKSLKTLDN